MGDITQEKNTNKKFKIFIAIVLLLIVGLITVISIISISNSKLTREDKILNYLEDKYNEYFEVVRLIDSGEKVLVRGVSIDGSTLIPKIKSKNTVCYVYEIRSFKEDIFFNLVYEDKNMGDKIYEPYFRMSKGDKFLENIASYTARMVGDENAKIEISKYEYETYGLEGEIRIDANVNFDESINKEYIEKNLREILKYIKKKINEVEDDVSVEVDVYFNNGVRLWFYDRNVLPIIYSETSAESGESYTPYEYMNKISVESLHKT